LKNQSETNGITLDWGSAMVSMRIRIRIQNFIKMRIHIQGAKPIRIHEDPDPNPDLSQT
jgi:hypothetical protein